MEGGLAVLQSWGDECSKSVLAWAEFACFVHADVTFLTYFQPLNPNHTVRLLPFLGKTQLHYVCVAFDTKEETQEENCQPVPKPESRVEVCELNPCPPR